MEQRVSFVTLAVRDVERSRSFYVDGLGWAPELDVPGEVLMFDAGDRLVLSLWDRAAFEAAMEAELARHGIDLIALAGFMRVLTEGFVTRWAGRMVNIHPSLLPSFPGVDTHARALAAGVRLHGCTVHLVTPGVDEGPIIAQAAVPVLAGDTEDSLGARVLEQEHALYPAALALVAQRAAHLERAVLAEAGVARLEQAGAAEIAAAGRQLLRPQRGRQQDGRR